MAETSPGRVAPEQRESPYAIYADSRQRAPVFYAERFGFWVVTRHGWRDIVTGEERRWKRLRLK